MGKGRSSDPSAMARDDAVGTSFSEPHTDVSEGLPAKRPRRVTPSIIIIDDSPTERVATLRNGNRHSVDVDSTETQFLQKLRAFLEARADLAASGGASTSHVQGRDGYGDARDELVHNVPRFPTAPIFCREKLHLSKLYDAVQEKGGYHVVTRHRLWRSVCVDLDFDLAGQTSASYAMRNNYERCGLFLFELAEGVAETPVSKLSELAAEKARIADALAEEKGIRPHVPAGGRGGGTRGGVDAKYGETPFGDGTDGDGNGFSHETEGSAALDAKKRVRFLRKNLPSYPAHELYKLGKPKTYNASDAEEASIAKKLNLLSTVDSLSHPEERAFLFPGINENDYVTVRNHILSRWRDDPAVYLPVEHACTWFRSKFRALVHCAHRFLTTAGLINFGVGFASNYLDAAGKSNWGTTKGAVVVIGAGLAGLQCARQLIGFGHRVVVLEARNRAGGRVWSKRLSGIDKETGVLKTAVAEMGGSIITGSDGNPLSILARQLHLKTRPIRDTCPMYLERENGEVADAAMDDEVFAAYNDGALEAVNELRSELGENSNSVTLGNALERVRNAFKDVVKKTSSPENDLWHWHLANLEFANATRLDTLSLGQWDQDDPYEFGGDHEWLPRGNSRMIAALARDLPIFYETVVKEIEMVSLDASSGTVAARVTTATGSVFVADAAVVTVPLGVLKRGDLKFTPDLPARKKQAIENLGFGVLNKVLLLFPTTFWDAQHDTFGYVNRCDGPGGSMHRGRFFMFYSYDGEDLSGGSTLVALIAGDAALSMETSETDEECVDGVMRVLREIFSKQNTRVPDPVDVTVTRWGADPYAWGSYSNISPRGTGADYDALAEPIDDAVFFAGEATNRMHPATMHGAFLSGNREAARVHAALKKRGKQRREGPGGSGGLHRGFSFANAFESDDAWTSEKKKRANQAKGGGESGAYEPELDKSCEGVLKH